MVRDAILSLAAIAFLAAPALAHEGDQHQPAAETLPAGGETNPLCPVTTDEAVDPTIFADYEGRRVYFCCKRCRVTFLENPHDYVANLPQLEGQTDSGHDHTTDHGSSLGTLERTVRFAGRFHPVAVHFPIALLLSALAAMTLAGVWTGPRFVEAARVLVLIGAPMAVVATALGWAAGASASYPGELATVLATHRWLGTATSAGALTTLFTSERYWRHPVPRRRYVFLGALGLTAALVGLTGHFGGTLIHGTEHFSW